MKIVCRQGKTESNILTFGRVQNACAASGQGRLLFPKGVWRFKNFEEADEWTEKRQGQARNCQPEGK
jgi:hypothetical protein